MRRSKHLDGAFFLGWRFLIVPSPIEFSFQEQLKAVAIWGHRLALFHWIACENDWRWWKTQRPADEQSTESALSKRALFASDLELRQQMLLTVENKATIKANTYFGAVAAIQYPLLSIGAEKRTLTSRSLHQPLKDPQPHWQITRKAWEIWCSTCYARA